AGTATPKARPVEVSLCNKDMKEEEGAGNFLRSIPTRESFGALGARLWSFHDIQYTIKQVPGPLCKRRTVEKKVLHIGIMKPGLNAILGPTGSGKSSLLDVLAARKDPAGLSGQVLIDGFPQPPNFKCISGYVVQDDVVMGTLTVRENLLFSAALRLPSSISFKEKEERVSQIITELGLSKVADAKVGTELIRGVSGGERKRTNIGMELITEPPVLFLDEPTTGLDASTANAVLILLKSAGERGWNVLITSPYQAVFCLKHECVLLAIVTGYQCEPFNNPADFFLDVINGDSTAVAASKGDQRSLDNGGTGGGELVNETEEQNVDKSVVETLHQLYLNSSQYRDTGEELKKVELRQKNEQGKSRRVNEVTYANGFFTQLYWVSKRAIKNLIRNPQASVAQIAVTTLLALVVGAIFFGVKLDQSGIQNRVGSLFFVTTNQCFSSVSAIELFIKDKKLFVHQYTSGYYRVSAYFFALIIGDLLPMRTLPGIIFSCISYWMIGYQAVAGRFFFFMLTLVLVSYTATAMSLAISAGMDVVAIANLFITICFVFMLIFSGLLVNLPSVMGWLNWLKYFSIPRYGLTALQVNEFRDLYFCDLWQNVLSVTINICPMSPCRCYGETYLCSQGIASTNWAMWENIVALGCMTAIFLLIAYGKLRFMKKFT
uniref:ABC transporter domain-containing protein n=1 Tax=Gopherus evgoodei TaxID=1825980 RepID=A0A8C4XZK0_9SAUR